MSRLTNQIKGVGVLDPSWRFSRLYDTDTDVTEADPKPGTMETSDDNTHLVPQVLDIQTVSVTIQTIASGLPGVGFGVSTQAEVGYWLTDTETSADLRYLDQPTKPCDWRKPTISITIPDSSDAACYSLSGKVALYWYDTTHVGANHFAVWNPYTQAYENTQALTGKPVSAFICVPGTERMLRISMEAAGEAGNEFTDDYGATWTTYTDGNRRPFGPTGQSSDVAPHVKLRAAFDAGGNLLLAGIDTVDGSIDLFTSPDLGVSWSESVLIAALDDFDLVSLIDGTIGFAYVSGGDVVFSRIATVFDNPLSGERNQPFADFSTSFSGTAFQHVFLARDSNGTLWIWGENDADDGDWAVAASSDNGVTWFSDWYARAPYVWSWGTTTQRPISFRFAPNARGGLIAAAAFGEEIGSGAGIGGMLTFGEWRSNPIEPKIFGAKDGTDIDRMWVGWIRPEDGPVWTKVGTATSTLSSSGDGSMSIASGAGALQGYYSATLSAASRTHADAIWGCRVTNDGGSAQGGGVQLDVLSSSSNKRASVACYLQSDGFRVRDEVAGAFMGAKVSVDLTQITHFEMHIDDSLLTVDVTYRHEGSTQYTRITRTGLTTTTSVLNGATIACGQINGIANATSSWYYWAGRAPDITAGDEQARLATGLSTGSGGYTIPDLSDATLERPARLVLYGGHSMIGEQFSLATVADYAVANVFPDTEPSPDRKWRSLAVGANQDIATDRGADATFGSYTVLLAVMGANARFWRLHAKVDGGGAYVTLGTLDLAVGFELVGATRTGMILQPGTGTAGARYIWDGEADGGHVIFDPAGTPVVRYIEHTVAGFWNVNATGPRAALQLAGIDGTEPTTGNVAIVWPSGVMPVHLTDSALYRYTRVRCLSTNVSPDTDYRAGVVGIFGLRAYGKDWGNGWEIDQVPNVVGERDTFGTERRKPMGGMVRSLTKSWDHGLKLDRMRGQTDADYIGAAGKAALAARDEVWQRLVSIWQDSNQGSDPVVVMMADPGSGITLTDPTLWLYGYPDGSVRVQQAVGQDSEGVFLRAGPVKFVEIK